MIFTESRLPGAFILDLERAEDGRGFFARTWCQREFSETGLSPILAQCSLSFNRKRGTLRGMHYQLPPNEETRLVRCARGAIFDVIVDLRPISPTFKQWFSVELTADNRRMIYVPKAFAHGFQTLDKNTEVEYFSSEFHIPDLYRGIRWDDPSFGIHWPIKVPILSEKDQRYPNFEPQ